MIYQKKYVAKTPYIWSTVRATNEHISCAEPVGIFIILKRNFLGEIVVKLAGFKRFENNKGCWMHKLSKVTIKVLMEKNK